MSDISAIPFLIFALLLSGCASRPTTTLKYEDVVALRPYTNEVVNSVYQMGYAFGYRDFEHTHKKRMYAVPVDPPYAERAGYLAGIAAAYDFWLANRNEFLRTNTVPLLQGK